MLIAIFVSATLVALRQVVRLRDPRQAPLVFMFALLAVAHSQDGSAEFWWHVAAAAAGLAQLFALAPRHHHPAPPPPHP